MKNTVLIVHPPKLPDWTLQVQMGLMDVDVDVDVGWKVESTYDSCTKHFHC